MTVASVGVVALRRCPGREDRLQAGGPGSPPGGHSQNSVSSLRKVGSGVGLYLPHRVAVKSSRIIHVNGCDSQNLAFLKSDLVFTMMMQFLISPEVPESESPPPMPLVHETFLPSLLLVSSVSPSALPAMDLVTAPFSLSHPREDYLPGCWRRKIWCSVLLIQVSGHRCLERTYESSDNLCQGTRAFGRLGYFRASASESRVQVFYHRPHRTADSGCVGSKLS